MGSDKKMIYIFEGINNECSIVYDDTELTQKQKERERQINYFRNKDN